MERLSDFLLHLDVILRAIPVDIFQGVQSDFPIQLDSSTTDLDLDAVTNTFATSAKELDCYIASLAELQPTKAQRLQKKTQEAENKLKEVNRLLEEVVLELKQAEALLTQTLESDPFFGAHIGSS
ncbi:hypothetical protein Gasu2_66030 [Galdieria sulphuraria]|uniref:Uncharacterized protein n=1 Tax=Galdieria sulphuraria TaxID=130081 RepID=M2XEG4_GALSU|nr:hypothetical protein Gasu_41830 isoform 1 [Galdieria sulphuraria]EME28342.1 hypothetical protein isoform 1 [Galdieria sulphuraria]GJD12525.1 hypothetical protein Gasu2_66030 [Galdieria sulphuraria]|eukprot:XP_005704862.1 hypothetical protein isoform 1 [Galdieria sulphuraria]